MDSDTGLVTEKHLGSLETRMWMDPQELYLATQELQKILETDAEQNTIFLQSRLSKYFVTVMAQ